MTSRDDQQERRRQIIEDRATRAASTYFERARIDADLEMSGRFAALAKPVVTGTSPYPQQPSTAPGNQAALVGDEPPLGFSVDAMEPVGTAAEIEEAERILRDRSEAGSLVSADPDAKSSSGSAALSTETFRRRA